jgi:pyrroline-5-carboxylate reductase
MTNQIAFIGAGNMAGALIGGLLADGVPPHRLIATDPSAEKCAALSAATGIRTLQDNRAAAAEAQTIVLAVKPQVLREVANELAPLVQENQPLVISIAAGIGCASLEAWLGGEAALVRTMPNTPAMIQSGATVLFATNAVSDDQREQAESLMRAVGLTQWIDDESLMDAVTALSGSGPAYFFLVMEAMEDTARELGLAPQTARLLTLQTALGAARMALESSDPPETLRARVTSPGGTTERAIATLEDGGLRDLFARALKAASDRSREISADLGGA